MDNQTIAIIMMALPSLLGGLKILSRLTKNTWDDKIIDALLSFIPKKK